MRISTDKFRTKALIVYTVMAYDLNNFFVAGVSAFMYVRTRLFTMPDLHMLLIAFASLLRFLTVYKFVKKLQIQNQFMSQHRTKPKSESFSFKFTISISLAAL